MKKKIFGIKLGTILTVFMCLIIAFAIWLVVNYRAGAEYAAFVFPMLFLRG